jgi:WD40 repeat protein/transcriptional regulator with XRE-family HTH domain
MKRYSYSERDYAFGQRMLTLRSKIGLTQAGLAKRLGVSRRAVSEWEAGSNYPTAGHLQHLLELGVQQRVFAPEQEEEEIRALWKAAHQKVLLDEVWLSALLQQPSPPSVLVPVEESGGAAVLRASAPGSLAQEGQPADSPLASRPDESNARSGPRVDWGEALDVPSFYGREEELATLTRWVVDERCRLVSVLGLGGIGKSALVTSAMRQVAEHFQVVLFRSLRDAPSCEALLENSLQVLAPRSLAGGAADLKRGIGLLLELLREQRVLLVLDNLEALLEAGEARGRLRPGYEDYARLLQAVAETAHQSCLLLTSREKPPVLRALEGRHTLVRSLRLLGLSVAAGEQLLTSHALLGSPEERARLVERYEGNPLALSIVAESIVDLFGGHIVPFLAQDTLVFGSISDLLDEQGDRLSPLEQTLLFWLAILREPVTLQELQAALVTPLTPVQVLEAVDSLHRRSLVERGQRPGSFTLQSVVLEYVTDRLVSTASEEVVQGQLRLLREQSLAQAQASDYVRQTQERLLVAPLLARLQNVYQGQAGVEERLRSLLSEVRGWGQDRQGYAPANLVTLLRVLRGHLRGLDLSRLVLRSVYLQGVEMQDANLSRTLLQESVFTQTFDAITAVAISPNGQCWAAASKRGEVRVWEGEQAADQTLHLAWQAHTDTVLSIAFSPDGRLLASGSWDNTVKLWDIASGSLLWTGWHTDNVISVAFAPDGRILASAGSDGAVRLWDPSSGRQLERLSHPAGAFALSWSPDGHLLASGGFDGHICLWQMQQSGPATCVQTLAGHSNLVRSLAFATDGSMLASASWDGSIKLWEVGEEGSLSVWQTLAGHTDRVNRVVWSPDGGTLASGSHDYTIRLWDAQQGNARRVLQGHRAPVYGLAFTPDSRLLLSGSEDGTLRVWDVERGEALRVLQGYPAILYDVTWSPDGTQIASAGADSVVTLWEVESGAPRNLLYGHNWTVFSVAWSPDGRLLASSGWDNAIRLWEPATGSCIQVLRDFDHPDTFFTGLAWSPDGERLASGTLLQGVLVWDVTARSLRWVNRAHPTWIRHVAWSPDGRQLVGGGDDGHLYLWDASNGTLLKRLAGHHGAITSVAFSPDGTRLASGGGSQGQGDSGQMFVWQVQNGQGVRTLSGHPGSVSALSWAASEEVVVSGGSDGRLRWWQVESGQCVRVREAHQGTVQALKVSPNESLLASCGDDRAIMLWDLESGEHLRTLRRDRPYERLNITGIRGLSEAQKASLRALGAFEETSSNE